MAAEGGGEKLITANRRAFHDYHILDRLEAGIVLTGTEVKSLRVNGCSLVDGYATVKNGEIWLMNVHVPPYQQGTFFSQHEARRDRKLLLHAREIARVAAELQEKGLSIVPLRVYFKRGVVKVEVGIGRGKKQYDKRAAIKQREARREVERVARRV
jgi:SsrA-binding protein